VSRGKGRTTPCTPAEARGRRKQAREFLNVADMVLTERATGAEAHVAAALAVVGAIAAADAICGLQLGSWSRGQDHSQAVALLETVDLEDLTLPKKLRQVLSSKDAVHYSPRLVSTAEAVNYSAWPGLSSMPLTGFRAPELASITIIRCRCDPHQTRSRVLPG